MYRGKKGRTLQHWQEGFIFIHGELSGPLSDYGDLEDGDDATLHRN
jgi:hypothetical protein